MRKIKRMMAEIIAAALICSMVCVAPVFAADESVSFNKISKAAESVQAELNAVEGVAELNDISLPMGSYYYKETGGFSAGYGFYANFTPEFSGDAVLSVINVSGAPITFTVFNGSNAIGGGRSNPTTIDAMAVEYITIPNLVSGTAYRMAVRFDTATPSGESAIALRMTPRDLSKMTVKSNDKTYDGTTTVKFADTWVYYKDKESFLEKAAYTAKASTSKVGKAKVTFTAKAPFTGTKVLSTGFEIYPKGTSITKLTRGSKKFTVKWAKRTTQTSGYKIRYSTSSTMSNSKIVYVTKNSTTYKTISKLKAKKKYYVQVATYKLIGNTRYVSEWSAKKYVTTK